MRVPQGGELHRKKKLRPACVRTRVKSEIAEEATRLRHRRWLVDLEVWKSSHPLLGSELLLGLNTGIKLDHIYNVTRLVSEIVKIPIPSNKPITGDNEFTVESGMVADMNLRMMKTDKPFTTLPFAPELIGRGPLNIILGKMTGGTVIRDRLVKMGLQATKEQVAQIVDRVKRQAIIRKWAIPDPVFEKIVRDVLAGE